MAFRKFETAVHSSIYAQFRPRPPNPLIVRALEFLSEKIKPNEDKFGVAVDVGCGTGQFASVLSTHFEKVFGFDVSPKQIEEAKETNKQLTNIEFCVSPSEKLPLEDNSVQMVTVSQALHWFDLKAFFPEVERVLVDGGVLAVSVYEAPYVNLTGLTPNPDVEPEFVKNLIRAIFTDPIIDSRRTSGNRPGPSYHYEDVHFPFDDVIREADFNFTCKANGHEILGYIRSWSPYQTCLKKSPDQIKVLENEFEENFRKVTKNNLDDGKVNVEFPFHLICCRK